MPRIAKRYLDCVVYIYPHEQAALSDKGLGGSGFIVARYVPGGYQTFVVTNKHVIEDALDPVVRVNRVNGGTESFATNRSWWKHHPDGDDLSAYQLDISSRDHQQAWVWEDGFITVEILRSYLGLGSDVAMLGRFIGLNGLATNAPVARFGSIAAPDVIQDRNSYLYDQQTFVIDCQSVPGYSGSPVFAFFETTALNENAVENSGLGPWLLGIDWKHYGSPEEILLKGGVHQSNPPYIKGNAGLMGVIPAWRILPLLEEFEESVTGTFEDLTEI